MPTRPAEWTSQGTTNRYEAASGCVQARPTLLQQAPTAVSKAISKATNRRINLAGMDELRSATLCSREASGSAHASNTSRRG